jgi:hypothetical protein
MMNSWSKTCVDKEQNKCICVVDRYAWPSRPYGILEKETLKHKPTPGTAKYDTHTALIDHTVTASYSCLLILSLDVGSSRRRTCPPAYHHVVCTYVRTPTTTFQLTRRARLLLARSFTPSFSRPFVVHSHASTIILHESTTIRCYY